MYVMQTKFNTYANQTCVVIVLFGYQVALLFRASSLVTPIHQFHNLSRHIQTLSNMTDRYIIKKSYSCISWILSRGVSFTQDFRVIYLHMKLSYIALPKTLWLYPSYLENLFLFCNFSFSSYLSSSKCVLMLYWGKGWPPAFTIFLLDSVNLSLFPFFGKIFWNIV